MTDSGKKTGFQFTEKMRGFVTFDNVDFQTGFDQGKKSGCDLMFQLTIRMEDIDEFVDQPEHVAEATGYVQCSELGGQRPVEKGVFNLFVSSDDQNEKQMLYRLFIRDEQGNPKTLSGRKHVQDNPGVDIWSDTTTLYVNLFEGHIEIEGESTAKRCASGILHIKTLDFAKQLTTFKAFGPSRLARAAAFAKFGSFFCGSLWEQYRPRLSPGVDDFDREIARFTLEGVADATTTSHSIQTDDKLGLNLFRFCRKPTKDVVLLIHGLTTSTDMFIMPEHYNLVNYLHDHGWSDVYSLDFRMSNRFSYNLQRHRYNMDDIALYDYPPAIEKVRELAGPDCRVHVICHCLGSVSFMMSLFGKAVDGITSVIANSVALTPRIHWWSKLKLTMGPFFVEYFTSIEYLNPYWRRQRGLGLGKFLAWFISLYHRECKVPECHMLSFMWGTGYPAVYLHKNLHDVTHRRGGDLYGGTSLHYYRHVRKMVSAGQAVKYDPANPGHDSLPNDYFQDAGDIETPVLFITGQENKIFQDANIVCHKRLEEVVPGRHELQVFSGYGHQDVFMGKNNHKDVFPKLVEFLDRHKGSK